MKNSVDLPRGRAEEAGIDPKGILSFFQAAQRFNLPLHSFLLLRQGKVVAEAYYQPFEKGLKHNVYSCTKSFTATAVGFALDEGLFGLDSKIVDLLPEKLDGSPHAYVAQMTVEHLLKMATAFSNFIDPVTDDWTKEFLNAKPDHLPGTLFGYDTSGTHTLGELVQKFSGQTLEKFLVDRLFNPLGIVDFEWEISPLGINRGGGGLRLLSEDMAKFGLLYLRKGLWQGKQVLPKGWVELATGRRIDNSAVSVAHGGTVGYGYLFWCLPDGAFACLGLGGQTIVVLPEKDVVFVTTANMLSVPSGHYPMLDLFWQTIFPALSENAVAHNDTAWRELCALTGSARMSCAEKGFSAQRLNYIDGKIYKAAPNALGYRELSFERKDRGWRMRLCTADAEDEILFDTKEYLPSQSPFQKYAAQYQYWGNYTFCGDKHPRRRSRCASMGGFVDANTLVIRTHLLDTVQSFVLTCHFEAHACNVQIMPYGVYAYPQMPLAIVFDELLYT